jgi:hypothetical protein
MNKRNAVTTLQPEKHRLSVILVLIVLLTGCGTVVTENVLKRSYTPGKAITTPMNEVMLSREQGDVEKKKRWVGVLNSPDGYEVIDSKYSPDFSRQELVYRGKGNGSIKIEYQEFHAGSAVPVNQQTMTFNLPLVKTINVHGFQLKVIQADADAIQFVVIADK